MAALVRKYVIGKNRLAQGLYRGFTLDGGELRTSGEGVRSVLYLAALDGAERDCEWGRLAFDAELGADMTLGVRAFASNEPKFVRKGRVTDTDSFLLDASVEDDAKMVLFEKSGCIGAAGVTDLLLTGLSGRYLWICVEVLGAGSASLGNFRVYSPEDNFFNSFPEVYRTNGEFSGAIWRCSTSCMPTFRRRSTRLIAVWMSTPRPQISFPCLPAGSALSLTATS